MSCGKHCLLSPQLSGHIQNSRTHERDHILDLLFAETIASETKYFLCCPEAVASEDLLEKTQQQ